MGLKVAEKANHLDLKLLKDQIEFECPSMNVFTSLKKNVQGKAEWLDLNDVVQN